MLTWTLFELSRNPDRLAKVLLNPQTLDPSVFHKPVLSLSLPGHAALYARFLKAYRFILKCNILVTSKDTNSLLWAWMHIASE